jgi:hypothetical protein
MLSEMSNIFMVVTMSKNPVLVGFYHYKKLSLMGVGFPTLNPIKG